MTEGDRLGRAAVLRYNLLARVRLGARDHRSFELCPAVDTHIVRWDAVAPPELLAGGRPCDAHGGNDM